MSTKSDVLQKLEQNRGRKLSGQQLADELWITRAAVWKAIESLRADGYSIGASRNRGYFLEEGNDLLSREGILIGLPEQYRDSSVIVYQSVDSTNSAAKRLAMDGEKQRCILVSEGQTAGRGRFGKSFYSPYGTGLYMSLLLYPNQTLQDATVITAAAAVAVCRAIEELAHAKPAIKWVNDIYLDEKKAGGILTEAVGDFESGMAEAVIVGIGLNVKTEKKEFPEELRSTAASLFPEQATRNQLAARIASELFQMADRLPETDWMKEYKKRSLVLGRRISYSSGTEKGIGKAVDVKENGNLVVETAKGLLVLRTGQVRLLEL